MKSPPKQLQDDDAHDAVEAFIKQHGAREAEDECEGVGSLAR